jgi:hypothetical protein
MKYFLKKAQDVVIDHVKTNYQLASVKPGKCRYNFYCHANAVHDALKKDQQRIGLVVYIEGNAPIVHFVNEAKAGEFKDNTLGYWSGGCKYYFIRWISRGEYNDVFKIRDTLSKQFKKLIPWYIRLFAKFDC